MHSKIQRQDIKKWINSWKYRTPELEIKMWDYYLLRHWILKYVPRYGKVIEAGCGLGRIVFYLSKMGIDIDGIDFCQPVIKYLHLWQSNKFRCNFIVSDVRKLPYKNEVLSGYISLGVMEHFIDGPITALKEAFRVLRPGGIAIVSTPSISFYIAITKLKIAIKNLIKLFIHRKSSRHTEFFQYWYTPRILKKFCEKVGFIVTDYGGADILYAFVEWHKFAYNRIIKNPWIWKLVNRLENTRLNYWGAQAITISIKPSQRMHCFLCGEKTATLSSLYKFTVPLCERCQNVELAHFYIKRRKIILNTPYLVNPPVKSPHREKCEFCGQSYYTDEMFENFGFNVKVCKQCIRKKNINILLSNKYIQPIWRPRGNVIISNFK